MRLRAHQSGRNSSSRRRRRRVERKHSTSRDGQESPRLSATGRKAVGVQRRASRVPLKNQSARFFSSILFGPVAGAPAGRHTAQQNRSLPKGGRARATREAPEQCASRTQPSRRAPTRDPRRADQERGRVRGTRRSEGAAPIMSAALKWPFSTATAAAVARQQAASRKQQAAGERRQTRGKQR